MVSHRAALLPMQHTLCLVRGRRFSGTTSRDEASPVDARACAAGFAALGAGSRPGPPIEPRCAGAISRFSTPRNFLLFFGCYGGLNSLIARRISLIPQVTNLTSKYLKYWSLLCPYPRRFGLGTRFSLYLASNVPHIYRARRANVAGCDQAGRRLARRPQRRRPAGCSIRSSRPLNCRGDADMSDGHRKSVPPVASTYYRQDLVHAGLPAHRSFATALSFWYNGVEKAQLSGRLIGGAK
jgi:hypothetical protein